MGKCFTRRCRRVRRALGQNVNNSNNERNAVPLTNRTARVRRSSMTPEQREAADELMRNRLAKQEAEMKAKRNREWMNAQQEYWRSEPIRFRNAENIAREEAMIKELIGEVEAERQQKMEGEAKRKQNEEAAQLKRQMEEVERKRRLFEEAERQRKLQEEEAKRKQNEEAARKQRMANIVETEEERCQKLLTAEGLILQNGDNSAQLVRQRFRRWTLAHHPDRGGDQNRFQVVSNCMDVLFRAAGGKRKYKKQTKKRKSTK